ncbi:hypothetical protein SAMN04487910_4411 [Aquimarina amphilecti]|uniref:Uncharacterized protein n=1 Tax=Aquimarina amphilecti TaxID=1038014 RepID=A0A1H7WEH3_AQUAM|nr:hypothetical protein [Aquimarina amphilecti]SEM19966.1 hypothetical protein SAMN04487910_4411 [Aquimarina amphilecti]
MKTFSNYISIIITLIFFTVSFSGYMQEKTYKTQLETIYLKNTKEIVYKNTFSNYNDDLIASNEIKFKKEIKKYRGKKSSLFFTSNKNNIELVTASYLKIIRKAANRSRNAEAFKVFLINNLPQLSHQFTVDDNLEELYFLSRKDTFNGRIDALPSVL